MYAVSGELHSQGVSKLAGSSTSAIGSAFNLEGIKRT